MEKIKPLLLALDILQDNNVVKNKEYRFINREIGIVKSFANMQSELFKIGRPYRFKEGRILYVLQGKAYISANLIKHEITPQTVIVTPPDSIIEVLNFDENFDFKALAFSNEFLPTSERGNLTDSYIKQGLVIHLTENEWRQAEHFFDLIWNIANEVPFRREVVQHTVTAMLFNLRYIQKKKIDSAPAGTFRNEEFFRRFITLINEHSKSERNVGFYADKLCLSPKYLGTLIRQISNQTVMDWIEQSVILEAKAMLKHSNLLVYEISDELNFANPSFFSKFFKRLTGMSPQEYQKKT